MNHQRAAERLAARTPSGQQALLRLDVHPSAAGHHPHSASVRLQGAFAPGADVPSRVDGGLFQLEGGRKTASKRGLSAAGTQAQGAVVAKQRRLRFFRAAPSRPAEMDRLPG